MTIYRIRDKRTGSFHHGGAWFRGTAEPGKGRLYATLGAVKTVLRRFARVYRSGEWVIDLALTEHYEVVEYVETESRVLQATDLIGEEAE